jgi:hypothetical protein
VRFSGCGAQLSKAHRFKHVPDGCAWLVDGAHHDLLVIHCHLLQASHDAVRSKAVQACGLKRAATVCSTRCNLGGSSPCILDAVTVTGYLG